MYCLLILHNKCWTKEAKLKNEIYFKFECYDSTFSLKERLDLFSKCIHVIPMV